MMEGLAMVQRLGQEISHSATRQVKATVSVLTVVSPNGRFFISLIRNVGNLDVKTQSRWQLKMQRMTVELAIE
jgi:hypothetical protein